MLNQPTHILLKQAKFIEKMSGRKNTTAVQMIDKELESRMPLLVPECVIIYDEDGQPLFVDEITGEVLGYERDEEIWA